jgi:ATP-dependent protease ClpP protease subunit
MIVSMAAKWNKKKMEREDEDDGYADQTDDIYQEDNHIYFHTDIDRNSIARLSILLRKAEEYCIIMGLRLRMDTVPIYLHIYSNGGCIYSAFSAMDLIQSLKVPVYSVIEGATASAGTLISMICEKRLIRPLGHMLIHQLSSACWGKMSEMTDEYNNLKGLMKTIRDLYLQHTKLSSKKLNELLRQDIWLDATQSITYGLADEIYN